MWTYVLASCTFGFDLSYTIVPGGERTMWIPNWLYNSLPYIYSIIGMLAIFYADHPVGHGSGVLLILTTLLIFKLRKDYRAMNRGH
jgi:hypothetical protein